LSALGRALLSYQLVRNEMIIVAENKVRYWDVHENYRDGNELLKSDDYKSRRNTPVDLIDGVGR